MKHYRNTMWNGIHITIIGKYNLPQENFLCSNLGGHYFTTTTYQTCKQLPPQLLSAIQFLAIKWILGEIKAFTT